MKINFLYIILFTFVFKSKSLDMLIPKERDSSLILIHWCLNDFSNLILA